MFVEVENDEQFDSTLTGLIAMQLAAHYKKPTIVVREGLEGYLKGSLRGLSNSPIEDFRQLCLDSKCFEFAQGHANAARRVNSQNKSERFFSLCRRKTTKCRL